MKVGAEVAVDHAGVVEERYSFVSCVDIHINIFYSNLFYISINIVTIKQRIEKHMLTQVPLYTI